MFGAAVVGGLILGMIEGVSMAMSRISGQMVLNEQSKFNKLFNLKEFILKSYSVGTSTTINKWLNLNFFRKFLFYHLSNLLIIFQNSISIEFCSVF